MNERQASGATLGDDISAIADLGVAETLEVALDRNATLYRTAARRLLWQDPPAGAAVVLALVADVDIDGDERLDVIQLAVDAGPAVQDAAAWLLDRIDLRIPRGPDPTGRV